ncbi:bifunctional riboflavin kinase/FAD synthetase [Pseudoalteromonas tunicata]|uniref:Riboflavin biosynthesis protein n=1 Tax=Pseudoalteromonas tunicata D2 TaxID=87626 RepID=A4C630_9GAMM|nr:bifunctional riboflavin kinase/FAD synthetase [Pseudoalteromonas tunicata]ATC95407.1 riboflavin kinase / FMN adenylyltransferase [Pseudoalteromonas tunicata]AXT30988.1 bifunctional riboflavin kinase/FAD synthetase [Pseudoalteromonas tunicata]EAR29434.1 bifunctional protein [Pseudoalteromonas tunicata D2]MDP4985738.1 bifunctional riboflavin kinase/FAD synthetase [Pseudoalteromonas tunicata]MDP5213020.1 bifunctional riboflavin kinase/FAD synthetase [Pseudoalteromonas tunicata]
MELVRGVHNIRDRHRGCVLTIGNFDGVHLGHVAVLNGLIADAKRLGLPSTVMLFEPQPQEFFAKNNAPARLTRLRDKLTLLKKIGIERVICIQFNATFAKLAPEYFVDVILHQKLGVKALTVGDDFKFGINRSGDFNLLQQLGEKLNISVQNTASFRQQNSRVSSTAIRKSLENADFAAAQQMLGHSYSISGRVIHGWKKGRELGFPTANIALKRQVSPLHGVFAVSVATANGILRGVANIGCKPTLNGKTTLLEVHLFDFSGDLYGKFISVEIVKKLRDEQKFDTLAHLISQIQADVKIAKQCFI